MAISSPLKSKIPKSSTTTVKKFQTILFNRTRVKKEIFQNKTILQNRRVENERRVQAEEELEAPDIATKKNGPAQLIAGSAKGFFERILGFLGYVTAGWIINNLPTWISMGKEFIARTQQMGRILGNFIKNTTDIFQNFTGLLSASLTNIISFDFLDTSGRVGTAFEELQLSVDNWGTGFEDAIKLITTPLTEGIASGEDARPTGTQNTDEGAYERGAPYSGSDGSTTTYSSTGGKKISKSEFGRGFGVKDGIGSGKSRTGHTGLDVPMDPGTPLSIVPPGTVHFTATEGISNGYGNLVVIKLDDGRFIKLNHLSKILVTPGEKVGAGSGKDGGVKVVGLVGYTGYTVPKGPGGSHMHIDVGTGFDKTTFYTLGLQDPAPFVIAGGVVKGGDVKATGEVKQQKSQTSQPQQQLVGTSSPSSSGGGKYKPLLDLISSGESSGGGYSAMYPSENYPQILNMSIAEVVEFQKQKKKDGRISAAIGRYQMMYPENYASAGGIPLTAKFSPENQDKMAIAYLKKNRRLSEWEQGKISDEALSEELAREFGAFKSATGFVLPGNTGSINFNKLKPVLKQIKSGSPQTQSSPTQAQTSSPTTTKSTTQSSPTQTQAQITPTGTPQNQQVNQSLTPERRGQTVIISQNPSQPQQQTMPYGGGGGSSGGGSSSQTSEFSLLNIFMKNKLLLDLAYL